MGVAPTVVGAATKHYVVGDLGEVSSHFGIPDIFHFWHDQPTNMIKIKVKSEYQFLH